MGLVFITSTPQAQTVSSPQLNLAYDHLLNYQIDSCQRILEKAAKTPYSYYLQLLSTTTLVLISDNQDVYKSNKSVESKIYAAVESQQFSAAEAGFLKAEIRLQWGLLKLKYGDEFAAFWNLKQAFSLAKSTTEQYPDYLPCYKTMGLLHAMFGLTPEKYNWVLSLFGLEGDQMLGLSELKKVAASEENVALESRMILGMLHTYLLGNPTMGAVEMDLVYKVKPTILTNYLYSLVLMKNSQSEHALQVISNTPDANSFVYFSYLSGEILLQKGQFTNAIGQYQIFMDKNKGESLQKEAFYKVAICFYLLGNETQCYSNLDKVLNVGLAKNEADKYAEAEAMARALSYPDLYRLRYATDGGFFEMAQDINQGIDPTSLSKKDQCEYFYRAGRLNHKTGDIPLAIEYYKRTMTLQEDEPWYFAPNSALQLATLYISENKRDAARQVLDQLDSYKDYPYKSSIRQQSKSLRESID